MADQEQEFVFVEDKDKINFFENLAPKAQNKENNNEVASVIINNHFEKLSKFAEDEKNKVDIENGIDLLKAKLNATHPKPRWEKYKYHSCKTMDELNELIDDIVANWGKKNTTYSQPKADYKSYEKGSKCQGRFEPFEYVDALETLVDEYQFGNVCHDLHLAYKVALLLYRDCDHSKPNFRFDSIRDQLIEAYKSQGKGKPLFSPYKEFHAFLKGGNKITREMLVANPGEWN